MTDRTTILGPTALPKFRKKPVVIEAVQYLGPEGALTKIDQAVDFDDWIVANQGERKCRYVGEKFVIPTLEGDHEAAPGDWIIRGVKGELYPCKPDIFEATYDPVDEGEQPVTGAEEEADPNDYPPDDPDAFQRDPREVVSPPKAA